MQETWVRSLGGENPLGEETATHSTILAGTFRGAWWATVQRVTKSQTWLNTHTHTHTHILVAEHGLHMHRLQGLWCMDLVTSKHVWPSKTRDWTRVPCIGRWIPNHGITREVQRSCPFWGVNSQMKNAAKFNVNDRLSLDYGIVIISQFSLVQSLSRVWLLVTPWTAARHTSVSITKFPSLLKLMSIKLVMPSNHLILCHPLLLLPAIFPSIRVFSNESVLHIKWPKDWSFSFNISPSNEYSGQISFRIDWFDLLALQRTLKSLI